MSLQFRFITIPNGSYGATEDQKCKTREYAILRARQSVISESVKTFSAFTVVQQFNAPIRQWEDIITIYAENGIVTQEVGN